MKHSIAVKFIAFFLCVSSLVAVGFSGVGIAFTEGYDLNETSLGARREKQIESTGNYLATYYAQRWAAANLGNAPQELLDQLYDNSELNRLVGKYRVEIYQDGECVWSTGGDSVDMEWEYRTTVSPSYPVVVSQHYLNSVGERPSGIMAYSDSAENTLEAGVPSPTEDEVLARVAGQQAMYSETVYDNSYNYYEELGDAYRTVYTLNYYQAPSYDVYVGLSSGIPLSAEFMLASILHPYRDSFVPMLIVGLLVFSGCFVFLCTVAGRNPAGEIHLAAINRIPLDVYGVCLGGLAICLALPVLLMLRTAYYEGFTGIWNKPGLCILICCLCGFGMGLCLVGFVYAFAAQAKAPDRYWLRHSCIGWLCGLAGRAIRKACRGIRAALRGIRAVVLMLPVIWQWVLTAFGMALCVGLCGLMAVAVHGYYDRLLWSLAFLTAFTGSLGIVLYGGWCFGMLLKGAKIMNSGDLHYKIDTRFLWGTFRDFGEKLNSLADATRIAAEQQMKSERMKTELITNVSHDIKTPLTSIINYVDLLKKPHSDAEGEMYLEVLDRQSQRLKKLIEDLMEMSKASSGNMTVEITRLDAVETINQTLGEFSDKLERAGLTPVFRHPKEPVMMKADGRLVWRVLSNLLSNTVKYAMPDTRLYIDLMVLQGNAVIAIKNVSKEQLNVNADELMERFVRGDTSRNTEGSGLGLNIAKSLVELQKGQMHLMVDGDLFKVTVMFPCS